jgi:predicted DNA-binding ribbon-helix-helix protein
MPRTSRKVKTHLKSQNGKRSVVIAGRESSVCLEDAFWIGLKEAAVSRDIPLAEVITEIAGGVAERNQINLSSALRTYVLEFYREQVRQQQTRAKAPA